MATSIGTMSLKDFERMKEELAKAARQQQSSSLASIQWKTAYSTRVFGAGAYGTTQAYPVPDKPEVDFKPYRPIADKILKLIGRG